MGTIYNVDYVSMMRTKHWKCQPGIGGENNLQKGQLVVRSCSGWCAVFPLPRSRKFSVLNKSLVLKYQIPHVGETVPSITDDQNYNTYIFLKVF